MDSNPAFVDIVVFVSDDVRRAEMIGVNIASLGCTCGIPARRLLVYGGDQAVAIEYVISAGCELRTAARR
jgi:hypothetical protein